MTDGYTPAVLALIQLHAELGRQTEKNAKEATSFAPT